MKSVRLLAKGVALAFCICAFWGGNAGRLLAQADLAAKSIIFDTCHTSGTTLWTCCLRITIKNEGNKAMGVTKLGIMIDPPGGWSYIFVLPIEAGSTREIDYPIDCPSGSGKFVQVAANFELLQPETKIDNNIASGWIVGTNIPQQLYP